MIAFLLACFLSYFSLTWLYATLWALAHQIPLSMGFSRQEYWNGMPCPLPGGSSQPRDQTPVSYVSCIGRQVLAPPGKPTHTIRTHSRGWTEKHKWNNSCYQGPQAWPCRVQTPCTCFCFYQQVPFCWVFARHLLLCSVFYKYYLFNLYNPVRYVPSSPLSKGEFQDSGHWVTCPESHTVSSQVEKQTQAS